MRYRITAMFAAVAVCICSCAAWGTEVRAAETFDRPVVIEANRRVVTVTGEWAGALSSTKEKPAAVVTIKSGFSGTVELDAVTIQLAAEKDEYVCALYVEPGASPTIVLKGKNVLASGRYRAGIEVPAKAGVTIESTESSGFGKAVSNLTVTGGQYGAGIGGADGMSCGRVSIGTIRESDVVPRVSARGGSYAAGVGGGMGGSGGTVTIFCGLLEAIGQDGAQDIGYGSGTQNGQPGTTEVRGGRLLRFENIGWSKTDSGKRQEVKVLVKTEQEPQPEVYLELKDFAYPGVTTATVPSSVVDNKVEEAVAYLYVPANWKEISFKEASFITIDTKYLSGYSFSYSIDFERTNHFCTSKPFAITAGKAITLSEHRGLQW